MTRRPLDPEEHGSMPDELDPIARELERYTQLTAGEVPHGLAERVMASLSDEPTPRRGLVAWMLAPFSANAAGGTRMVMVAGTMALAVLAVVVAGRLADLFDDPQIGPSPSPPVVETPSPTPSATPSPTPSPSPSASPTPTPSPSSATPVASPTGTDDGDGAETPEPSDEDNSGPGGGGGEIETPEPSDEDNSGPGGGGDGGD
jgi:hypothetical protein